MIKLTRLGEPQILKEGQEEWTLALLEAVRKYGDYEKIPKDEKARLIAPYRSEEIKEILFSSSNEKCAFCECFPSEGGNIEVEHFAPKSIHPNLTFDWANLLPCCRKCNEYKGTHDTVAEPIVNPYAQDPREFFYFDNIALRGLPGEYYDIAKLTISVCKLNSSRLLKPRAAVLASLHDFASAIDEAIALYHEADTDRKRQTRLRRIRESIERIEALSKKEEKYSAFCRWFLDSCEEYREALQIIALGSR